MITTDKAIEIIKEIEAENSVSFARRNNLENVLELLQSKTDAEKFRTPKEIVDYDDPTARFYLFTCPTCRYHLSEGMKYYKAYDYCPHCGQAIKWPEVE